MSQFPTEEHPFKQSSSAFHLSQLTKTELPLILKKAKGVYLYDIDGNKFSDFYLQNGEISFGHSPSTLTKYAKNALSSGLGHAGAHGKFASKAQSLWQKKLQQPVSLYTSPLDAILALIKQHHIKEFHYAGDYCKNILQTLEGLLPLSPYQEGAQWVLYEPALSHIKAPNAVALHSRFFYRTYEQNFASFNLLHTSPFGGRRLTLLFGEDIPRSSPLAFDEETIIMEGAKFKTEKAFPIFHHPLVESHTGYAILKKEIDTSQALAQGVSIYGNILFFSPAHSTHDFKRLRRFLDSQT